MGIKDPEKRKEKKYLTLNFRRKKCVKLPRVPNLH